MDNDEVKRRVSILLAVQKGMRGEITPNLRAIFVDWGNVDESFTIKLYFVFDKEISDDDIENGECIATEVFAYFPEDKIDTEFLRIDYPHTIPHLGKECVFFRKEIG